jgi:hypothetical protein
MERYSQLQKAYNSEGIEHLIGKYSMSDGTSKWFILYTSGSGCDTKENLLSQYGLNTDYTSILKRKLTDGQNEVAKVYTSLFVHLGFTWNKQEAPAEHFLGVQNKFKTIVASISSYSYSPNKYAARVTSGSSLCIEVYDTLEEAVAYVEKKVVDLEMSK